MFPSGSSCGFRIERVRIYSKHCIHHKSRRKDLEGRLALAFS